MVKFSLEVRVRVMIRVRVDVGVMVSIIYISLFQTNKSICIHKILYIARLQTYICRQVNRLNKKDTQLKLVLP